MNSKNAWQKIPGVICEAMVNWAVESLKWPERETERARPRGARPRESERGDG
jgi:hypothetical protein